MPASTLNTAALATLERAINGALEFDVATREQLAALAGTSFGIHCTVPGVDVYVFPGPLGLRLQNHYDATVACAVRGAASDFLALVLSEDKAGALVNGNLRISGDSAPLLALEKILSRLDLDWEQQLAVLLGDVPAHQIGRTLRGTAHWGRSAQSALLRHIEEYIHEEGRLAPPREEVEDFFTDLRDLSVRTDRLTVQTRRMVKQITALEERVKLRRKPSSGLS